VTIYDDLPPRDGLSPDDFFNPFRENNPSGPELVADDVGMHRAVDLPTIGLAPAVEEEHAVDALVVVVEMVGGEEGAPPS
jgi:hypothetical protein